MTGADQDKMTLSVVPVIVTHNRLSMLKKSLAAIESQPVEKIVIVDNQSSDGTGKWLKTLDPSRFDVISSPVNSGGAGGFYTGACRALAGPADWILFFDDDAVARPGLIERFMERIKQNKADLVSTSVVCGNGGYPVMNSLVKKYPSTLGQLLMYLFNKKAFLASPGTFTKNRVQSLECASFVGLFVSRNCLEAMHRFILPSLFVYCDDLYFTLKCHQKGYRHLWFSDLEFIHHIRHTKDIAPWQIYLLARNQFVLKEFSSPAAFAVHAAARLLKILVKAAGSNNLKNALTAVKKGIHDGMKQDYCVTCNTKNPLDAVKRYLVN